MPRRLYSAEEIIGKSREAEVLVEQLRHQCNRRRPHSSLANRPPALEVYPSPISGSPLTAAAALALT